MSIKKLSNILFADKSRCWWIFYSSLLLAANNLIYKIGHQSMLDIALAVGMAALTGLAISAAAIALLRKGRLIDIVMTIFVVIINILILTDIFLISGFGICFDENVYSTIKNTNFDEAASFAGTYFSFGFIAILGLDIAANVAAAACIRRACRRSNNSGARAIAAMAAVSVATAVCLLTGAFGCSASLSNYSSIARFVKPLVMPPEVHDVRSLIALGRTVDRQVEVSPPDSTKYVLVIGESHSVFHSQPYGYRLDTEPVVTALRDSGELVVYTDCISGYDYTGCAFRCLYSYGRGSKVATDLIFPQVFKAAGFHTGLFDNEYKAQVPVVTYSDPRLTEQCFSFRSDSVMKYDGDMCRTVEFSHPHSLTIVNLIGQHYDYCDRLPDTFARRFDTSVYPGYTDKQKQILADYDNCIAYTDSLLGSLIDKLRDDDACVIYVSDHGEEVYELGDFMGHGSVFKTKEPKYQLRVPMYIWGSEKFRSKPVWQAIARAADLPVSTDDLSHFLTDLAGISFTGLDVSRSFINEAYDHSQPRTACDNYFYIDDKLVKK